MNVNSVSVYMGQRLVGELAETPSHRYAFAYSEAWLKNGFNISPFSLPLEKKVFVPEKLHFNGLFGIFEDSLPDSWGRLLVDRMLASKGFDPSQVSPLQRLCIVGDSGMGALNYKPNWRIAQSREIDSLDEISRACQDLLLKRETPELDALFAFGGSSGGARPKVITDEWIIKFPASAEDRNAGCMEKEYMDSAAQCGIEVPETKLFASNTCAGYFGSKRFDRVRRSDGSVQRKHMATVAALLELDWRVPSLDYHTLMKLTKIIRADSKAVIEQMYRRMCFNVFAHNRDDHAKNFSFIYDECKRTWQPSPAYDLTYSNTYYGEHTTSVNGNSKDPSLDDLMAVGTKAGLSRNVCRSIALEIASQTSKLVAKYKNS